MSLVFQGDQGNFHKIRNKVRMFLLLSSQKEKASNLIKLNLNDKFITTHKKFTTGST